MTNLEAKAYFVMRLKDKYKYAKGYTTQREAFERAIEVLEKQIPRKPIEEQNLMTCAVCGCQEIQLIDSCGIREMNYCPCCGQAIEVLEVLSHRCSNCKYNDTCKGVAVEEGNTIKFHSDEGYCCMWEESND